MKYLIIVFLLVSTYAQADLFGNDQNNRQTNRQQVDQRQQQQQRQNQEQSQRANARQRQDASSNNVYQESHDYQKTYQEYVSPAYAPPLAATGDCLGSASAGGSNSVMGFSIGKTYVDENCNARYDSILLHQMGRPLAAIMRLCSQPEMAKVLTECAVYDPAANDVQVTWD